MRMRWLAKLLAERLASVEKMGPPGFTVGPKDDPYLMRWFIIPRNKLFNIYLHHMRHDDDDVLHDHPWWSVSLALTDGLRERAQLYPPHGLINVRWIKQGDIIFRTSHMAHQIIVDKPAWTLFITGPVLRTWGFWCPKGWRPFNEYVKVRGGNSQPGRGCGEMS